MGIWVSTTFELLYHRKIIGMMDTAFAICQIRKKCTSAFIRTKACFSQCWFCYHREFSRVCLEPTFTVNPTLNGKDVWSRICRSVEIRHHSGFNILMVVCSFRRIYVRWQRDLCGLPFQVLEQLLLCCLFPSSRWNSLCNLEPNTTQKIFCRRIPTDLRPSNR